MRLGTRKVTTAREEGEKGEKQEEGGKGVNPNIS